MIIEVAARVWMKCLLCGHYNMWTLDEGVHIGLFEMLSPDIVIQKLKDDGWEIDEEGAAKHIDIELCRANLAKIGKIL